MDLLKATLALYREAVTDATKGLGRSVWALAALVIASAALTVLGLLVGGLGMAGGFIMGFAECAAIGWYLSLVEIGVVGRRRIRFDDLQENLGAYFWEVISILFIFFIGQLLLMFSVPWLVAIAVPVATLLFNPAPEMIYQERTRSLPLLQEALSFMQLNWPEWLGAQALGALVISGWALAFGGGSLGAALVLELVQLYGPWFGFVDIVSVALGLSPVAGVLGAALLLVFSHWFLLFRGHLYRRLRGSSRRQRAWQARM